MTEQYNSKFTGEEIDDKLENTNRSYPETPQIDITLENAVKTIDISELAGKTLEDYNFHSFRFHIVAGAQTETKGNELQIYTYLKGGGNLSYISANQLLYKTSETYWAGGCNAREMINWQMTPSNYRSQRTGVSVQLAPGTPTSDIINMIKITNYVEIPVGTRIRIWLK